MSFDTSPSRDSQAADEQLRRRIADSLLAHNVPSLRHVQVEVSPGVVRLSGQVNTFYAKQLSQHSARRFAGDSRVINEVRVATPAARSSIGLRRSVAAGAVLMMLMSLAGCGEAAPERLAVHPVSGQVTFNGQPVANATLTFHRKDGTPGDPRPSAQADAQGKFSLMTYEPADGAPAGEYVVTLEQYKVIKVGQELELSPNLLPPKYGATATSNVVVKVAAGTNAVPIRLTR